MAYSRIRVPVSFTSLWRLAPWSIGYAVASALLSAAFSILPFWFIYLIAVELFTDLPDFGRIWRLALIALLLFLLRWLMMALSHFGAHFGAYTLIYRLRRALIQQLGKVPLSFFTRRGSGGLRRTINDDVGGLEEFYAHMLPDTVAAAGVPFFTLILLFFADWRLALAVLIPLPLALFAQWWWMAPNMSEGAQQWGEIQRNVANQVGEYVRCIAVIKSFGLGAHSFGQLGKTVHDAVAWVENYSKTSSGGFILFNGLLRGSIVLVAPLGAWLYLQGSLDLPTYILFLLISPLVLEPLLRLMFAAHELQHKVRTLEQINAILQESTLEPVGTPTRSNEVEMMAPPQTGGAMDVEFKAVGHRYDTRSAVKDISFTARAGEMTAIVGPSGSGKSTLLRLVARLYEYEQGSISIAGRDIRDWPLDAVLAQMAVVFQDVFLFSGTVRENLRLARPQATDEEIELAAQQARAHDFISALPQGYDTLLGENGARLSGGERQRLSIARALLKNAPILLLDEATSSLDAENETEIRQALYDLCQNRTVLMVCHNLHTAMAADQIVLMQEGSLLASGRHEDLLRDCQPYQLLWRDHVEAQDWEISKQQGETS